MAYQIKWTIPAKESHGNIADYLIKEWSEKEVKKFINIVEDKLQLIAIYPDLFPAQIREGIFIKLLSVNKLFYSIVNIRVSGL